jgi:hypothetical protein
MIFYEWYSNAFSLMPSSSDENSTSSFWISFPCGKRAYNPIVSRLIFGPLPFAFSTCFPQGLSKIKLMEANSHKKETS